MKLINDGMVWSGATPDTLQLRLWDGNKVWLEMCVVKKKNKYPVQLFRQKLT